MYIGGSAGRKLSFTGGTETVKRIYDLYIHNIHVQILKYSMVIPILIDYELKPK